MISTKQTLRLGVAGLVLASAATLVGGGAANAATVGGLSVIPASDTTTSNNLQFATESACPAPATNAIVRLRGTGMPAAGFNLMGNTSLSLSTGATPGGGYTLPGQQTFFNAFNAQGVTAPNGVYDVAWICTNGSGTANTGEFVSHVTFTHGSAGNFDASYTSAPAAKPTTITETVPASAAYGSSVTFNATVAPNTAVGTVQFKDGGSNLGGAQTVTGGAASYTTAALAAGPHSITAVFTPTDSTQYDPSTTSAAQTITISQATTTVSLTGPASSPQYAQADYIATVTPNVAGSVGFSVDSGAPTSVAVSNGTATFSTSSLGVGNHSVVATFTPSNTNYSGSTSNAVSTDVTAFSGVSAAQPITVAVPAGSLTISIAGTVNGVVPVVDLGTAVFQPDGQWFRAQGQMNDVTITDTRSANPGWNASGTVTDFTEAAPPAGQTAMVISGGNLGWTPHIASSSTNQNTPLDANAIAAGAPVASGLIVTGGAANGAGLSAPKTFATTHAGRGDGAAVVNGGLDLYIPTDVRSGSYNATLTFTVM